MLNSNLSQVGVGSSEPSALLYRPIRLEWVSRMPFDFLLEKEGLLSAGRYLFGGIVPFPKTTAGPPCFQRVTNSPCVLRPSAENNKGEGKGVERGRYAVLEHSMLSPGSFVYPVCRSMFPGFAGGGSAQPRRKTDRPVTAGTNRCFPSEHGGGALHWLRRRCRKSGLILAAGKIREICLML